MYSIKTESDLRYTASLPVVTAQESLKVVREPNEVLVNACNFFTYHIVSEIHHTSYNRSLGPVSRY